MQNWFAHAQCNAVEVIVFVISFLQPEVSRKSLKKGLGLNI